ncbi:MAG: FAD-binding protein [Terriglobia bacterium]
MVAEIHDVGDGAGARTGPMIIDELARMLPPGRVLTDNGTLQDAASDFGRIAEQKPAAVVRPRSTAEVQETVRFAAKRSLHVTPRGAGHSQSGQSLSDQIALDLRDLNGVLRLDPEKKNVACQAGITWRRLLETLLPAGLSPPVLTNNLDVTVGGSISTAGLGVSSWRYGTQADHCLECEAVTGSGDAVRCSPSVEPGLFDAVRAGLGQFGAITEVNLRLRRHKPRVRTLYLLYDDLSALLNDMKMLMQEERFDYLEAWCTPLPQGFKTVDGHSQPFAQWFFPLHASYEIASYAGSETSAEAADDASRLRGLRYYKHVHTGSAETGFFFSRLDPLFALWRRSGFWDHAHPWVETVLPWESAAAYLGHILASIPPQALLGGHILLWPGRTATSSAPLFVRPPSGFVLGVGILPAVPRERLAEALPLFDQTSLAGMLSGGKRYLSGWVNFNQAQWQAHYGELWPKLLELKRKYDPHSIFPAPAFAAG